MFTPIHLLPQSGSFESWSAKDRWETPEGRELEEKITQMLVKGAGEHFLQAEYQSGNLGFLEDDTDLKGFKIFQQNIKFPTSDNFKGIDFSFAEFYHSTFTGATFFSCTFRFTKFYNCTFKNCSFVSSLYFAASFEKVKFVDCDFAEYDSLINCPFTDTHFNNVFFSKGIFHDCRFDTATNISPFPKKPVVNQKMNLQLPNSALSELYKGIGEAYESGGVHSKARNYLFLHSQAANLYNSENKREQFAGFFFEYISGYGLRPFRVIASMVVYFLIVLTIFASQIGFRDALIFTSGALFTYGAKADLLDKMGLFFQVLYISSSFVGISLTALFITVLVNVFVRNK